jgi:hypothetical protein
MNRYVGLWLMVALLTGSAITVVAQASTDGAIPPPKVLVVFREFIKPGKSGTPHVKTESAFVQAMTAAKWPTRYLGTDSMSGPPRSLFFTGYDSFEAWEKDNKAVEKNRVGERQQGGGEERHVVSGLGSGGDRGWRLARLRRW